MSRWRRADERSRDGALSAGLMSTGKRMGSASMLKKVVANDERTSAMSRRGFWGCRSIS